MNALKAASYQLIKQTKGTIDLKKGQRAEVIQRFLDRPEANDQAPLLAPEFTLTCHAPNWTSDPYATLTKYDFLIWMTDVRASCPHHFRFEHGHCDGLRDPDGSVMMLIRPSGRHTGAPYEVNGGFVVQPSDASFLMALTELKIWVDDSRGLITHIKVLAPRRKCPFLREGMAESLVAAPYRSTLSYTSIDYDHV